ncbi:hypothetical protein KGQ20_07230 [Catenulispora sp. NF23]|uniref:hypothetical protein n=1 Tax=Catenulispora pinistramenti TaxID=2705254 RepID=UPI001BA4ADD1|nr:hypothetical protein [Catenulispora pinistramenti]MBS2532561.1 hypothetical protein [Catenulispora pinistramenti]
MYELNRVRLYNIGPTGARYDDVLLDLSDGGPLIPTTTLIPSAGQVFRRPALATLLVLENGGGKSVFIRMLLSTVLPERQSQRGRKALRAYVVSAAAPSHVVLEWVNVRTGETLITGQVLAPGADGKVDRLFYTMRPNGTTTLTTLPFAEGRRRQSMNAFHDALKRLDVADKSLHVEIEKRQGEWENHLRRLGLEPDLFAVQQAMNVDEGDAAEAFKTTTGKQFVEWLLSKALDAEDFTDLGNAFAAYAKNIGRREQLLLDRDFSTVMAQAAQRLATQVSEQVAAQKVAHAAGVALAALAAEVKESVQRSEQTLSERRQDVALAKGTAGARQEAFDQAELVRKEVNRRTLLLQHGQARAEADAIKAQLDGKRAEAAAWALAPKVLKAAAAHEKYRVASAILDAAQQAAGLARTGRDKAGAAFAGALNSAERRCRAQVGEHSRKGATANTKAADLDRQAGQDEQQAAKDSAKAELLTDRINDVEQRVKQARDSGVLRDEESVAEADARWRKHAEETKNRADQERAAHKDLESKARELEAEAGRLIEPDVLARQAAKEAALAVQVMEDVANGLLQETLLRELSELSADEPVPGGDAALWLEQNGPALRDQAIAARGSAEDQLNSLADENRADERLIAALTVEDDALLPARQEVEDLVAVLADNGIAASAGWRALEQLVNPARHAQTIQSCPAAVDGIVIADAAVLDKARDVLAEARLLPAAAVLVTTAAELQEEPGGAGVGFVVEPTPALHDPSAAAKLREQAERRIEDRQPVMEDLAGRRESARALADRLNGWLDKYPAGDIERLQSEAASTTLSAAAATKALQAARNVHKAAIDAIDDHAVVVAVAEQDAAEQALAVQQFSQLVTAVNEVAPYRTQIEVLEGTARGHLEAAQTLREQAEQLRSQATEHAVQAESFLRDAASFAERRGKIVYGDQVLTADDGESDLAALEIAYQEAADAFHAVEVGQDLRQRVTEAETEASRLDTELLAEPAETVARSKELASQPEAGSAETLEATKRRLARAVEALEKEHYALNEQVGGLKEKARAAGKPGGAPWAHLDDEWVPSDPADGAVLTQRADALTKEAQSALGIAAEALRKAESALRTAETTAHDMTAVHRNLQAAARKLEAPTAASAYAGTAEAALQAAETAIRTYGEASDRLNEADDAVNSAVAEFREAAAQPRFGKLQAPVYAQLARIDKAALIARADQWAVQLDDRAASLISDLESSERHRNLVLEQLKHHTNEALGLLEKAERLSRLPEGAGVWTGRRILKIGFARPDAQILLARIAESLDENARTQPNLPGRDLVLRCVTAAVPRDFKVEILKPDAAGRAEYASISEMGSVFSGGQELTGAIMLYCTLAALRSSTRTGVRNGSRLGGMLILDNPIGKASADYLLSLQINMAAALGVQLIYTTGNMEDRVLATFPLCIRLRNDADQRSGNGLLHVIDRVVGETDDDGVTGRLTAARLLVKPRETESEVAADDSLPLREDAASGDDGTVSAP